jgi:hypothetical protein
MAARIGFWVSLSIVGGVFGGGVAAAAAPAATPPGAPAEAVPNAGATWSSPDATLDPALGRSSTPVRGVSPGFEGGLRVGIGLPVGRAGRNVLDGSARKVGDVAPWRAPIWIDAGYRASALLSYGAYGQLGVGGAGDSCTGKCNWADLRLGVQLGFHFAPERSLSPWLGIGAGYEWLSVKSLSSVDTGDVAGVVPFGSTELLGGPELGAQAGLDFQVDDTLRVGPYAAVSVGDYLGDSFKCQPAGFACPSGSSIDGSGVHAWLGVGVRGSYSP